MSLPNIGLEPTRLPACAIMALRRAAQAKRSTDIQVYDARDRAIKGVMAEATNGLREFFEAYAKATGALDLGFLGSAYGDTFMFASPGGVQAVKRDDFLKVLPKRAAFFKATGLVASEVASLEEMRLDERHTMVKASWALRFEKDAGRPIIDEIAATYVLRRQDGGWQIVFQLDHQDLSKRVQELGLLRSSG